MFNYQPISNEEIRAFFIIITLIVILFNIYLNVSIYRNQIAFQRSILSGQAEASAGDIESSLMKFENEVNAILYSNILLNINITSDDMDQDGLRSLEVLFTNNHELIRNIYIYDVNKNVLNLSFNKRNNLLIDPYVTQRQNELLDKESFTKLDEQYQYSFPVFNEKQLVANIVFTLDIKEFFQSKFSRYYHDDAFWQWIIDGDGNMVFTNTSAIMSFENITLIKNNVLNERSGFLKHRIRFNNDPEQLYSAFTPLKIVNDKFGVVFSMRKSFVFDLILTRVIVSGIFSTIIMLIFLIFLFGKMGRNLFTKEKTGVELFSLQSIFDNLPVGIMVLDQNHKVKIVNQTAKEMLLMSQDELIQQRILWIGLCFPRLF